MFLVFVMLRFGGVLDIVNFWSKPFHLHDWLYWFPKQAAAIGFLVYVLYRRAHALRRPGFAAHAHERIALPTLELGLVLFVAFYSAVFGSFTILLQGLPLEEPALTQVGQSSVELRHMFQQTGVMCLLAYVLYRGSRSFSSIGLNWSSTDVAWAIPVVVAAYFVNLFAYPFAEWCCKAVVGPELVERHVTWHLTGPTVTIANFFGTFLNGFFEEVIVRAYLMTQVLKLTKSGLLAVLCSVVVQVSYHFYQGAPGAFGHIGWCLLFSLFYLKTKRVLPLVLAHNDHNFRILIAYAVKNAGGF
jgi:membrane protease YdiL (CAAX protease family)